MADDDFWVALLTITLAVLAGAAAALRWIRIARLIEDTPTSRIRSAAQGYVELTGRVRPLPETQNLAPLTKRPCVWWRYRISKKVESGRNRRQTWQTVASGRSSIPFLLDDGTGECIVKPDGAEVVVTEATTWYGNTPWPAPPATGHAGVWLGGERSYRYSEERIYEHETLHALGGFRTSTPDADRDLEAEQAALLSRWKQDQAELVRRFDNNGDGSINLAEWEAVREAARRAVQEMQAARPAQDALHVLGKPDGQLYLLAALPPADLARRFRRRALWAFAGFVVAVCALGWVIQDGFG